MFGASSPKQNFTPLTRLEMSYPQLTSPSGVGKFCKTDYLRHDRLLSATMGRIVAARLFRAVSHVGLMTSARVKQSDITDHTVSHDDTTESNR